jgi:cupin fold WbuC family metalloprotein
MNWREVVPDVFYPESGRVAFYDSDFAFLVAKAKSSVRGRARLCAHPDANDGLHEMLICLTRDGYVRPHRHSKPESASMIRGSCDLVLFDEQGNIADVKTLGEPNSGKAFFIRLSDPIYHTYLLHTDTLLFLETTPGPFDRERSQFAPWAPAETGEFTAFQQDLLRRVALWKNERCDVDRTR